MTGSAARSRAVVAQNNPILVYFSSRTYFISYSPARAAADSFQLIEKLSGRWTCTGHVVLTRENCSFRNEMYACVRNT